MPKKHLIIVLLVMLMVPTIAQSDGIPLQKDVWLDSIPYLQSEIRNHMDLPDQITFNLYDSKTATTPIATQTFQRGQYTVDFEFSKSDGRTSGTVARINADITNRLNISDDPDTSTRVKEIWLSVEVVGREVGALTNAKWIEERVINIPGSVLI